MPFVMFIVVPRVFPCLQVFLISKVTVLLPMCIRMSKESHNIDWLLLALWACSGVRAHLEYESIVAV